jgi:hypothetical protein
MYTVDALVIYKCSVFIYSAIVLNFATIALSAALRKLDKLQVRPHRQLYATAA